MGQQSPRAAGAAAPRSRGGASGAGAALRERREGEARVWGTERSWGAALLSHGAAVLSDGARNAAMGQQCSAMGRTVPSYGAAVLSYGACNAAMGQQC